MERPLVDLRLSLRGALRLPAVALRMWAAAAIVLAVAIVGGLAGGMPVEDLFRDPAATLDAHPLTGAVSNLGVLVWSAGAAICFFSSALLRRHRPELSAFFFWSGAVTTLLCLDDFFLFHDDLAKRHFGLKQGWVERVWVAGVVLYLFVFRRVLLTSGGFFLLLSLSLFGGSVMVDQIQHRWISPWRIVVEDGLKFLGIVGWTGYFIQTTFEAVTGIPGPETRRPGDLPESNRCSS